VISGGRFYGAPAATIPRANRPRPLVIRPQYHLHTSASIASLPAYVPACSISDVLQRWTAGCYRCLDCGDMRGARALALTLREPEITRDMFERVRSV
jgi:hypothetical protein